LKNRFRILYNKPFHPYKTQVKLVIACCILHNWILGFGLDHIVSDEDWLPPNNPPVHPDPDEENLVDMTMKRYEICNAMWEGRGTHRT
jgi:hypothetical protein